MYALLWDAVRNGKGRAFIGSANVRNSEGVYRLTIWRDRLVLQRMLYPEDLNDHEPLDHTKIDSSIADKFSKQLSKLSTDFDPEAYRNTTKERVAAVQAAFAAGEGVVVAAPTIKKPAGFDIMDALEAFDGN